MHLNVRRFFWLTYPVYQHCLQQPPPQSQQIFPQHHPPALDPRPWPSADQLQHQSWPQLDWKMSREQLVTWTNPSGSADLLLWVPVPAGDVLSTPGDCDAICSWCSGVILKPIHSIPEIFPLVWLLKTLWKQSDSHYSIVFSINLNSNYSKGNKL